MRAKFVVNSLTINDGTIVEFPDGGVVLVVGPNNAGKSQLLRDIASAATSQPPPGVVAVTVELTRRGSADELRQTFEEDRSLFGSRVDLGPNGQPELATVLQWWESDHNAKIVSPYFLLSADTESRLLASKAAQSMNLYEARPQHPLHHIYIDRHGEAQLDQISREAFNRGQILDTWSGGDHWSLRVGEIAPPNDPRPGQEYLDELVKLPLLEKQGDGVRSMIGLLLNLFTGHQSVSLVDEPEAFLHPPQARYLARVLSEDSVASDTATFLSTHSADVVHGTLEGPAATTVIRLVRNGDTNSAAVLSNTAVRRLWSDPLLRYSNLLEGLFTDAVVVCESDADCKFFASMRDTLEGEPPGGRRPDLLFTSCGGKHRMHVAVEALRAASVPVAVIGDFDVLNDWAVLSRLVTSAGGDPDSLKTDWGILNGALTATSRTPSVTGMREAVEQIFAEMQTVTPRELDRVRAALKIESGWDRVKNTGLAGVPKGDAFRAAERLIGQLAALRIHLVPVGEMEDFVPAVPGHGPAWVAEVLEQNLHSTAATDGSRAFFASILQSIGVSVDIPPAS